MKQIVGLHGPLAVNVDATMWHDYLGEFHSSISMSTSLTDDACHPWGCRAGAVVRALASHQCGLGSIPKLGVICGLSLLALFSAPTGFLRVLRFPLSSKSNI